jgi:hypothetical protein
VRKTQKHKTERKTTLAKKLNKKKNKTDLSTKILLQLIGHKSLCQLSPVADLSYRKREEYFSDSE